MDLIFKPLCSYMIRLVLTWVKMLNIYFLKDFTSLLFTCCFYRLKCTVVVFFFFLCEFVPL